MYDAALRVEFRAGICVSNGKLFVVKCRIATKGESARVTAFQLHEQFFIFLLQPLEDAGVQDHPDVVNAVLILAHDDIESPMQFHAGGH